MGGYGQIELVQAVIWGKSKKILKKQTCSKQVSRMVENRSQKSFKKI